MVGKLFSASKRASQNWKSKRKPPSACALCGSTQSSKYTSMYTKNRNRANLLSLFPIVFVKHLPKSFPATFYQIGLAEGARSTMPNKRSLRKPKERIFLCKI